MSKKQIIILPIVIILTMGCSTRSFSLKEDTEDNSINKEIRNPIDGIVYNRIIVNLDADENMLVKELGEPLRIEKKDIKNRHYDFNDMLIIYYYPGLEITYYHFKHPEYEWKKIVEIEVSSNDYDLKCFIKMGMHISEIYHIFGKNPLSHSEFNGTVYITYLHSEFEYFRFVLKNEMLVKFTWSCWPD